MHCFMRFTAVLAILAGLFAATPARADEASALESFKQAFQAATNGTDPAALTALEYPNPQAAEAKYADFMAFQAQKDLRLKIPAAATFKLEPLEGGGAFKVLGFIYPVAPTHKITIDYQVSEYHQKTVVREMVYDAENDKWWIVAPLPGDEMIEKMGAAPAPTPAATPEPAKQ
jgi:hypothetical protein